MKNETIAFRKHVIYMLTFLINVFYSKTFLVAFFSVQVGQFVLQALMFIDIHSIYKISIF